MSLLKNWYRAIRPRKGTLFAEVRELPNPGIDLDRFETIQAEMDSALAELKETNDDAERRFVLQRLRKLLADADTLVAEPWKPSDARIPLALKVLRELLEKEKVSVPDKTQAAEA